MGQVWFKRRALKAIADSEVTGDCGGIEDFIETAVFLAIADFQDTEVMAIADSIVVIAGTNSVNFTTASSAVSDQSSHIT